MRKTILWALALLVMATAPAYADTLAITPWSQGDSLNATNLNSRHTTIQNLINGNLSNVNIKANAAIVGSKLDLTDGTSRLVQSGTLTTDQRMFESTPTWNSATTTFEAWLLNVTDSASASESRLLDLQVDGVSKFYVGKGTATRISAFGEVPFIVASGPTLTFTGTTQIQQQRFVQFDSPIITNTSAQTIDAAATVYIASGPRCQGNVTCTGSYGLWVDNGTTRLDGALQVNSTTTLAGHLLFTDNTYDIGASGATRPRHLYISGDATIGDQLVVSGTGPHAIGGATNANRQVDIKGTFNAEADATGAGLVVESQINIAPNRVGIGAWVASSLGKAASGTHADFAGLYVDAPVIVGSGATVTNASTIKITGAPTGATNNYTLWSDAGVNRFDQGVFLPDTAISFSSTGNLLFGTVTSMDGVTGWAERARLTGDGILALGTTDTTNAAAGDARLSGGLWIGDGIAAPTARAGFAVIYVDTADGDLKVKFGDGTTKVLAADT